MQAGVASTQRHNCRDQPLCQVCLLPRSCRSPAPLPTRLAPPPAGVELGVNYPYPVISVEDSLAALAAADAVVQQCMRGGTAAPAAVAGAADGSALLGPFRPATDADPAEAERLFAEHYRWAARGRQARAFGYTYARAAAAAG